MHTKWYLTNLGELVPYSLLNFIFFHLPLCSTNIFLNIYRASGIVLKGTKRNKALLGGSDTLLRRVWKMKIVLLAFYDLLVF